MNVVPYAHRAVDIYRRGNYGRVGEQIRAAAVAQASRAAQYLGRELRGRLRVAVAREGARSGFMPAVRAAVNRHNYRSRYRDFRPNRISQAARGTRGFGSTRRGAGGMHRGGNRMRRTYRTRYGGRPRYLRAELKSADTPVVGAGLGNSITLASAPITGIPQGAGSNQRIGRKVILKSLHIAGRITSVSGPTTDQSADTVWCWIIQDRQSNASNASVADVWNVSEAHQAMRNLDQNQRFKILKCFEIKVDYGQSGVSVNSPFEEFLKCNIPVTWTGGAGGSPITNNILVYMGTSNNLSNILRAAFTFRVRFTDI